MYARRVPPAVVSYATISIMTICYDASWGLFMIRNNSISVLQDDAVYTGIKKSYTAIMAIDTTLYIGAGTHD